MTSSRPGHPATFAAPMLIGAIAAQRAAGNVRTVDFLLLFFGGLAFGVGVAELVRFYRNRAMNPK